MAHDPLKFAALQLFCKHRRFMYINYMENFKLFVSWYLAEPVEIGYEICPASGDLPWYRINWTISELAKILKLTDQEVLGMLEEIYDDY